MRQHCTGASQEVVTSSQTKSDAMTVKLTSKKIQDNHSCPPIKFRHFGSHVNICGDSNETVSTIALQLYQVTVTATVTVTTAASAAATVTTILTASV